MIADVMKEVERLRGFDYAHPVVAQPVEQQEIAEDLVEYADVAYPRGSTSGAASRGTRSA